MTVYRTLVLSTRCSVSRASGRGRNQTGFTLLEVLVALFVFSIGFLGLAALQTLSLRFTHQSYERTQAALQAYEIIDRMRANREGLDNYTPTAAGATPTAAVDCASADCTPAQMAAYDLNEWLARVRDPNLLAGEGAVCRGTLDDKFACTEGGSIFRVGVRWNEQNNAMRLIVEAGI